MAVTFLRLFLGISLISVCVPIVAGMLGVLHPALDAFSHFRIQLLVILVLGTMFALWLKLVWVSRLCAVVAVVATAATLPHFPGLDRLTSDPAEGEPLTIVQLNLRYDNPQIDKMRAALSTIDSDFIVLQEVTELTEPALDGLTSSHPFQLSCRFEAVGSVAIASKHPFVETTMRKCIRAYGLAMARFSVNGRAISVGSYHSYWPWPFSQHQQIDFLEEHFQQVEPPVLLAGDFNAVPWSHAVQRIAALTKTKPAAGLLTTWTLQAGTWRAPKVLGLPIDNTLHSDDLSLQRRYIGLDAGSDHLPVISQFRWVERAQSRSAKVSNNLLFRIFPVEEAGNASAMMMREGLL